MRWLEFIKMQYDAKCETFTENLFTVIDELKNSNKLVRADLLVNAAVDGDIAVLLEWEYGIPQVQGSFEGNVVSELLRKNGLTNHSVWKVVTDNNKKYNDIFGG